MKKTCFAIATALLCLAAAARSEVSQPRLVRVPLGPALPASALLEAGLDVVRVRGGEAQILEWPGDAAKLAALGAKVEILDARPGRSAALRAAAELSAHPAPGPERVPGVSGRDRTRRVQGPPAYGSGSMGGFWTTAEIKMKLDQLVAGDANDVVADKVDTLGTSWRGRPIWGLRLGKRVTGPDTRPVAFFNALAHSREPQGMQTLFYFVDDLLGRYASDPFARYLLDHRVIYVVPLVNPDGYRINEDIYVASGGFDFGFWRKNARDNDGNAVIDNQDGVDLNRNFSFQWAHDDIGSSGAPNAETYRGPSAFSEPESRAQRDVVIQLAPKSGLSFHTYSDLMIHPWGYAPGRTLDHAAFAEWSDELTRDNAYLAGSAPNILYPVNGEFNDWCYGDTTSKPRMFSWTPEIGDDNDGFWPAPSRIVPLARENLHACYTVAAIAGPYVRAAGVQIIEGAMNIGRLSRLSVRARHLGVSGTAGPGLTATLTPLDPGAWMDIGTVSYPSIGPRESRDPNAPFQVAVDDTVTPGRLLRFRVDFTAPGGFFSRDTIRVPAGTPTIVAFDDASSGLGKWNPGGWGIVANDPDHPSRYFTDSPGGTYPPSTSNAMTLAATLNLSAGVHAYAVYESRWEIEPNWDAAVVEASLDGTNWTLLRATGTTPGSGAGSIQLPGQPYYAGSRLTWKPERADLTPFAGPGRTAVRFRFRMRSDSFAEFDGFSFDSLRIEVYDPAAQPAPVAVGDGAAPPALSLAAPRPNPARGPARFSFDLPAAGHARLEILDVQGRRVRTLAEGALAAERHARTWDLRDEGGRPAPAGVYLARLTAAGAEAVRRFVVVN